MPRRSLQRPLGTRRYRRLFILSTEGRLTEPQYFTAIVRDLARVHVHCIPSADKSAPRAVLKRMQSHLREAALRPGDEAWLVVDQDRWTPAQLGELHAWSKTEQHYGFVVSNPSFEYWLLLHFEAGDGVSTQQVCRNRLRRHLPHYDKHVDAAAFPRETVVTAIDRARRRHLPDSGDWPSIAGVTTVYLLAEKLLEADQP